MKTLRATLRAASAAALVMFAIATAAPVFAQEEDPGESRAETFEAATGAQTENIDGGMLMVVAYGVVWVLVLGYVMSLGFHQARTTRELERLRRDIEAAGEREPASE